jgi:hypothetical protein
LVTKNYPKDKYYTKMIGFPFKRRFASYVPLILFLVSQFEIVMRFFAFRLLGNGIFTECDVAKWKERREFLQHAFQHKLEAFF